MSAGAWVIGQRFVSKKFTAYLVGRNSSGGMLRRPILDETGEDDALFDTEAQAMAAVDFICKAEGLPAQKWRKRYTARDEAGAREILAKIPRLPVLEAAPETLA